jgi:hypothetical protein
LLNLFSSNLGIHTYFKLDPNDLTLSRPCSQTSSRLHGTLNIDLPLNLEVSP